MTHLDGLGAERLQLGKRRGRRLAVGRLRPICANGLTGGTLPGLRRAATFHARRQVFMAWLTVVRRSRSIVLPSRRLVTTSSFS